MPITLQSITRGHAGPCDHFRVIVGDGTRTWTIRLTLAEFFEPITDDDIETVVLANLKHLRAQGATPQQMVGLTIVGDAP